LSIEKIFPLVEKELQAIEAEMTRNLISEIVMIPTVSKYLISSGGKRFRPMLLILCAKLCGYYGPRTVPLAGTIEFIHTASLLHDDVVDRAFMRRGLASANSVWGDGASVLVGDFLFTKAFWLITKDGDLRILDTVSLRQPVRGGRGDADDEDGGPGHQRGRLLLRGHQQDRGPDCRGL